MHAFPVLDVVPWCLPFAKCMCQIANAEAMDGVVNAYMDADWCGHSWLHHTWASGNKKAALEYLQRLGARPSLLANCRSCGTKCQSFGGATGLDHKLAVVDEQTGLGQDVCVKSRAAARRHDAAACAVQQSL